MFPIHVVAAWIGNTERIAAKHYLQVTDDYFGLAARGSEQDPRDTVSGTATAASFGNDS